jgi:hypothetical protein
MSITIKIALGRKRSTREIDRSKPLCVMTRFSLVGYYEPHPHILRQIEGADEAFFVSGPPMARRRVGDGKAAWCGTRHTSSGESCPSGQSAIRERINAPDRRRRSRA